MKGNLVHQNIYGSAAISSEYRQVFLVLEKFGRFALTRIKPASTPGLPASAEEPIFFLFIHLSD